MPTTYTEQPSLTQQNLEMQQLASLSDEQLTFSFIQSKDPFLIRINFSSTFSAVYEYNEVEQQNTSMGVEGSLFLLERSIEPFHRIYVLNRKSREDFQESVDSDFEFSEKGQYVAYTATLSDGFKARRTIFFA